VFVIVQKEISRLLVVFNEFHTRFYPLVFLLHLLVHNLPSSPLGKQVNIIINSFIYTCALCALDK